jgi:hypothetical protein
VFLICLEEWENVAENRLKMLRSLDTNNFMEFRRSVTDIYSNVGYQESVKLYIQLTTGEIDITTMSNSILDQIAPNFQLKP